MMLVAVYVSGVPLKTKNEQKRQTLEAFGRGVNIIGDTAKLVYNAEVVDCDVAVIQGWVNSVTSPHLKIRHNVIQYQRQRGLPVIVIDSNLFGFLAPDDFNRYLRYSVNGVFPTTGYYFDSRPDPERWNQIKLQYGFNEHPWNTVGQNILITLQRDGGWSMQNYSVQAWLDQVVIKIRQHTTRPIVVRPHPGNQAILKKLTLPQVKNIRISTLTDLRHELDQAWATVTYNSSPGVASLLWGVPAFITDTEPKRSQAYGYASTDLTSIETPVKSDRQNLYTRLSQCHFTNAELENGKAWAFMRQRLPMRSQL